MNTTALETDRPARPKPAASKPESADDAPPRRDDGREPTALEACVARIVTALASLKLTVTLFSLSIFLVFAGTLAQVEQGIWQVMDQYFRCVIAWIAVRPLTFGYLDTDLLLPYPGGWLIGGVLLVNLLAAHAIRFDITLKRSGLLLIHTGLMALMLSEFVTGVLADETQISFLEGETAIFAHDIREFELAVIDTADPRVDRVWAIPESRLKRGAVIAEAGMPFAVEVLRVMPNHDIEPGHGGPIAVPLTESPGVKSSDPVDVAAAYVRLRSHDGQNQSDEIMLSQKLPGRDMSIAGLPIRLELRFRRVYKPYAITLLDFTHDKYLGTNTPKNFASQVRVFDPSKRETRTHTISMNNPLRYRGETLYQHQVLGADEGSVLQVVRNPGWLIPYVSCLMISVGLAVHFCISLGRFSKRGRTR